MSETKLCPMLKVGMVVYQSATRNLTDPELEHATFLPCVQEKCAWWVKIPYAIPDNDDIDIGHCAILDIGRGR